MTSEASFKYGGGLDCFLGKSLQFSTVKSIFLTFFYTFLFIICKLFYFDNFMPYNGVFFEFWDIIENAAVKGNFIIILRENGCQNEEQKPLRIKIISMGNAEVGKSCIIKRYCEKRFVSKYMTTIGIDYGVTKVNIKDREIKVNIFDMAGHPVFYEVRNEFYKDTQGVVLVFDVSDKSSFEALGSWMDELKRDIGDPADIEKITFIVCANKIDKKRVVDETESTVWAQQHGCHYFETSAQTGQGIQDMFQMLFNSVVVAVENGSKPSGPVNTTLGYTKEQIEAIQKLKSSRDNFERLGLQPGATKDEINKAYRKLAVIIHPDKSLAPGTEEAFKLLTTARAELMQKFR